MEASDRTSASVMDRASAPASSAAPPSPRRSRMTHAQYCVDAAQPGMLLYNASGGSPLNKNRFRGGSEALSYREFDRRVQDAARQQNQLAERQLAAMAEQLEERDRQLELYGEMIQNLQQPRDAQDQALVEAELTIREQAARIGELSWEKHAAELAERLSGQRAHEAGAELRESLVALEELRSSLDGSVSEARALKESLLSSQPAVVVEEAAARRVEEVEADESPPSEAVEPVVELTAIARIQARARGKAHRARLRVAQRAEALHTPELVEYRDAMRLRSKATTRLFVPQKMVMRRLESDTSDSDSDDSDDGKNAWLRGAQHQAAELAEHLVEPQPEPEPEPDLAQGLEPEPAIAAFDAPLGAFSFGAAADTAAGTRSKRAGAMRGRKKKR